MPRQVYSHLFARLSGVPVGVTVLYTVPASHIAVVRAVDLWLPAGAGTGLNVGSRPAGGTPAAAFIRADTIATATFLPWRGRLVLNAGDDLYVGLGGGGSVDLTASGYLFAT